MSNFISEIKNVANESQHYAEQKLEVIRLDSIDKTVKATSKLFTCVLLGVIAFITLSILSVVIGLLLSNWLNSYVEGFSIVAVFYFTILMILFVFRKKIIELPLRNQLLDNYLE